MKSLFQRVIGVLFKGVKYVYAGGKYTSNKDAAAIIRRFIEGTGHPREWDDFETRNEDNPEADLAIILCWFFAEEFPSNSNTEYAGMAAEKYFLKIADALENDRFNNLNCEEVKKYIKEKDELPDSILNILGISKDWREEE